MSPRNQDVRGAVRDAGIYLWQVADRLGYTDVYFSKLLRKELPAEVKSKVYRTIEELKNEEKAAM